MATSGIELLDQEVGEPRRERVVLEDALVSILRLIGQRRHHAGIEEHRDHRRQRRAWRSDCRGRPARGRCRPRSRCHPGRSSTATGRARIVLGRHVQLIVVRRAREKLSGREDVARHRAFGHARLRLRVGPERVVDRRQSAERRLRRACGKPWSSEPDNDGAVRQPAAIQLLIRCPCSKSPRARNRQRFVRLLSCFRVFVADHDRLVSSAFSALRESSAFRRAR